MADKRRDTAKALPISHQLILHAHQGSEEALWELKSKLVRGNCTLEIIRAVLEHLQARYIPEVSRLSDPGLHFYRTTPCTEMLTPIGLACRMEEKLRPEATLLLLDHAEDICRWIDYWCSYLDTPGSIHPMAAAFQDTHMVLAKELFVVADADPRVLDAPLSFPKFYDVVVRLWTAKFEGEVIASSALLGICPIIGTLKSVIGNDHGLETLANKLLARRSSSIGFVRAFKNRVALANSSDKAPNVKLQHLNSLGSAADGFLILSGDSQTSVDSSHGSNTTGSSWRNSACSLPKSWSVANPAFARILVNWPRRRTTS
ncbi:hypothetical protein FA13DRAFT_140920 [Coprinellus micaceus]|uniref:Uncharacterized protein n=1 Tax=Coprinellus micaceus TaxID=71717 RepID=A0A4Y7SHF2_COPMI|nr:hypothetical protein FA13DRAFT_140920 [Coprinellus micaceus]